MGIVASFGAAGIASKIALAFLVIATLFSTIAFTCTGWGETDTGTHYGLWRICTEDTYNPGCVQTDGWALDWWAAAQALIIFGFIGCWVGTFLCLLYMFVETCQKNKECGIGCGIVCIISGILFMIGVVVFGAKFKEDYIDRNDAGWPDHKLSYSFGLAVVAFVFEIVAGFLMLLDSIKGIGANPSA